MASLVLGGRAFDGHELHKSAVLEIDTEKGVILQFGEKGSAEVPRNAKKIQIEDGTILPGLMDAHLHFYSTVGEGVNAWAAVPDTLAVLRAAGDLKKLLGAGFTTVRELGSKGGVHLAQAVAEGAIEGPDVISCSRALAQTGGDDDPPAFPLEIAQQLASYTYFCDGPWECRRAVRKVARDGGQVVKFYASGAFSRGGRIRLNFTPEEVRALVDESHRQGLRVAAHAYGEEALVNVIEGGVDSIEHGLGLTKALANEIRKKGIFYVPTLTAYSAHKAHRNNELVKRHLSEDLLIAREAGLKVVMGSDIVGDTARPHGRNYEEIVAEAKFLGNEEALISATSRAAECLNSNRGVLRKGMRADIAVVKGNPVENIHTLAPENVVYVIKSGRLLDAGAQS